MEKVAPRAELTGPSNSNGLRWRTGVTGAIENNGTFSDLANPSYPEALRGAARDLFRVIGVCATDDELTDCNRKIWGAYGAKLLDAAEADFLSRYVALRRPPRGQPAQVGAMAGRIRSAVYSRSVSRQRPRSPDRKASRDRRRIWARSGAMPPDLRTYYTEGQTAALTVIAHEIKQRGDCRLPLDKIAALAGVCRTTVQNALHEARLLGHVLITERPQAGRKSLTNIITIIAQAWRTWLRLGRIGSKTFKTVSPTEREESLDDGNVRAERPQKGLGIELVTKPRYRRRDTV